jgi:hypothetical protein
VSGPTKPRVGELILRAWRAPDGGDAFPTGRFEALMRDAVGAGLVREWDDGRGRSPWYQARRGHDERELLAACVEALDAEPADTVL